MPTEEEFYSSYAWCLNPILTLRELFQRLREELDRPGACLLGWQREECRTNLYLLVCGIACTVDDYLAWRPRDLSSISERFPRARFAVPLARWVLNLPHSLGRLVSDRPVTRWRRKWDAIVNRICEILVRESEPPLSEWTELRRTVEALAGVKLPRQLLGRRMRVPEGFRCQDLTHHDVFTLAQRFLDSHSHSATGGPLIVVGPRTAGGYFAPLIAAYLAVRGWPPVAWLTLRPKEGVSSWERRRLRKLLTRDCRVLVVDDYPSTGNTFRRMVMVLRRFGIPPERITILAPRHPARADWTLASHVSGSRPVTIITSEPAELHKESLLIPRSVEALLREYYAGHGWAEIRITENPHVEAINARLGARYGDGFTVRLKRLFEVQLAGREGVAVKHVFAKSVGWGWLGYHAYIAGTRLAGFVPPVIGLRGGLLFTEWVAAVDAGEIPPVDGIAVHSLSAYVARRTRRLRLAEDPRFESPDYGWTGWNLLTQILRRAYGPYVGRLKTRVLRRALKEYVSPVPALVDGRMRPGEWIQTDTSLYKVDFEHHNFGPPELDIVDPAYDLASSVFEFRLSEDAEHELLRAYARDSGDETIASRLLLYKLLYGILTMQIAARAIAHGSSPAEQQAWNRRYLSARSFLTYQMNRFCGRLIRRPLPAIWSNRLFFLDLDGVFDSDVFGFPHTTASGLVALALLRTHGVSVVPNTGRSVEHVWNYCRTYGLPGGLAEYGGVFVDAVRGHETSLIDPEAAAQLADCRAALEAIPGVFTDPEYRFTVRAYRHEADGPAGLRPAEMQDILGRSRFPRLAFIATSADTTVVARGTSKGTGLLAVKSGLGYPTESVGAMGDSEHDLPMLELADVAYAPANCAPTLRRRRGTARWRILDQRSQRALLAAVRAMVHDDSGAAGRCGCEPTALVDSGHLVQQLLRVAERRRSRQFLAALDWRRL